MPNYRCLVTTILALGIVSLVGCGQTQTNETTESAQSSDSNVSENRLDVVVSIPPQKYFVERIGGEYVNVTVMLPPGASPATYEPKPQQLQNLADAEAYARIQVPFENAWWERIRSGNPEMKVVDLTEGVNRMPMAAEHSHPGEEHHHHSDADEHQHDQEASSQTETVANPDPHIWLSPPLVKEQAQTIYAALVELDPSRQQIYQENLNAFIADLDQLDQDIQQTLSGVENRTFMVFHPAWGYFARAYNLEMVPIEVGGNEPSAAEMSKLVSKAKADNIQVIFAQPQFSTRNAKTIANEIGGEVILLDPLAEDWMSNMSKVSNTFKDVMGDPTALLVVTPHLVAVISK